MGRPKKIATGTSLDEMLASVAGGINDSIRKPNNLQYKPTPKQLLFHASQKPGKQYIGGNRSGKTTGGINEDIYWLRGQHPHRKVPEPPVIGRVTTVDFKNGAEKIIIPNLRQWIPPSLLINGSWEDSWNGQKHLLKLANDSELEIMSYDQELEKFAGVPRHFVHFDEEPPKDIFAECKARLIDYNGSWWMTMTPIEGMTWTYEDIFEPSHLGMNPLIDVIQVSIQDNTYLPVQAVIDILSGYDEEGIKIRGAGQYVAIGGLVFKHYDTDKHDIESKVPPRSWDHYVSLDAGYNNPTAVLWHAVSPSGEVVTYDEHYMAEWTVQQHAEKILAKEKHYRDSFGIIPTMYIADPAIKQRSAITGLSIQIEYSQLGIHFALGAVRSVDAGLDKMNNYLRLNKWFITDDCPNLRREMRSYKRAQYSTSKLREKNNKKEAPVKKNDHACDSVRYFFSYMPELEVEKEIPKSRMGKDDIARLLQPGTTFNPVQPYRVDQNLFIVGQEVRTFDDYVGEY